MKNKFSLKRELKSWGVFLGIIGILYFTGLHTEVAGFAQRIVLTTGLMTADTEADLDLPIDYNFQIKGMNGEVTSLEELKGKVIFLNEWATWCPPCIAEMPSIQNLYDDFKDNDKFAFVILSLDKDPKKVTRFIARKGYSLPVFLPASPMPDVFITPSIPTTFVISPEGKIITKKVGMAKYDTKKFKAFLLKQAE